MNKVTIKMASGKTMVFFDVTSIDKTTATVEISYNKKNGGDGLVIIPWSAISNLYIAEQETVKV